LELLQVLARVETLQEGAVSLDASRNEVLASLPENRAPLLAVGIQESISSPTLDLGG
jgi:hypothetical protein